MDNCQSCRKPGTLEVTDTEEVKPGLFAPTGKRAGCDKHPPIGLKIYAAGEILLVPPSGYTINQYGALIKG
jgi:hypothetical protein